MIIPFGAFFGILKISPIVPAQLTIMSFSKTSNCFSFQNVLMILRQSLQNRIVHWGVAFSTFILIASGIFQMPVSKRYMINELPLMAWSGAESTLDSTLDSSWQGIIAPFLWWGGVWLCDIGGDCLCSFACVLLCKNILSL